MKRKPRNSIVEPIQELDQIKVVDNGEELLSLRKHCPTLLFREEPDMAGGPRLFFLRESLIAMLNKASKALPKRHKLIIWSAFRTMEYQKHIYNDVFTHFKEKHPEWPFNILRRETNRFVHPPHAKTPPGHSTGGAVDLTVIGPDGKDLDMTSPFGTEREEARKVSATYDSKLTPQSRKNRLILIDAMTSADFTNYAGEWWHWSYGDSCWAWRAGRKTAFYGLTEANPEILQILKTHKKQRTKRG